MPELTDEQLARLAEAETADASGEEPDDGPIMPPERVSRAGTPTLNSIAESDRPPEIPAPSTVVRRAFEAQGIQGPSREPAYDDLARIRVRFDQFLNLKQQRRERERLSSEPQKRRRRREDGTWEWITLPPAPREFTTKWGMVDAVENIRKEEDFHRRLIDQAIRPFEPPAAWPENAIDPMQRAELDRLTPERRQDKLDNFLEERLRIVEYNYQHVRAAHNRKHQFGSQPLPPVLRRPAGEEDGYDRVDRRPSFPEGSGIDKLAAMGNLPRPQPIPGGGSDQLTRRFEKSPTRNPGVLAPGTVTHLSPATTSEEEE